MRRATRTGAMAGTRAPRERDVTEPEPTAARRVVDRRATFDGYRTFRVMVAAFNRALAKHPTGLRESFYTFGSRRVRLRVVGAEMAAHIARPFSHLRVAAPSDAPADLTIDLWDEAETAIRRQAASSLDIDGLWPSAVAASPDERYVAQQQSQTLTCFDRAAQHVVGCIVWNKDLSLYERGKPLTRPLVAWHKDRDVPVVHAGLVAQGGAGVLLAGRSGAGKSTCALSCFAAGLDYVGEDYVAIETVTGGFFGHSLYSSVFLEREHLRRFPHLVPHAITADSSEKCLILLAELAPQRLARVMPIRALVFPRVTNLSASRVRPASRREALLTLAPGSLLALPDTGVGGFELLGRLAERLPSYWLELGHDLGTIPERVADVLAGLARAC